MQQSTLQRVYSLCGVQRRGGGSGRQAGATALSCLLWRCELSRPDRPTSAFCVGVRPAVALAVPAPPDTLRRCRAVGPTQFTPPHQTRQNGPIYVVSGVPV